MENQSRDDVCRFYFMLGLCYSDILLVLAHVHGLVISLRTLKRIFRRQSLYRRRNYTDILDVASFIQSHINQHGSIHGYRWVHMLCVQREITVSRDTVSMLMQLLDPEGISLRLRKRLRRRKYFARGPDFIWHLDSYDKLKMYGLCINGCIDGFSRMIIWLRVYRTSSNPRVIGSYYLQAVQKRNGCPHLMRGDRGTENGHVAQFQEFFTERDTSFLYGRSTSNQRIEMFWNFLRKLSCQNWIEALGSLRDNGIFTGDYVDISLVQFCFMRLLERDLKEVAHNWNTHLIRNSKNQNCPHGRPLMLYTVPALYGTQNYLFSVDQDKIEVSETECVFPEAFPCDQEMFELCLLYMAEIGRGAPSDIEEGVKLYRDLRGMLKADL